MLNVLTTRKHLKTRRARVAFCQYLRMNHRPPEAEQRVDGHPPARCGERPLEPRAHVQGMEDSIFLHQQSRLKLRGQRKDQQPAGTGFGSPPPPQPMAV